MLPRKHYGSLDSNIKRDDLQAMSEQVPVFVRNIEIPSGTTVHRGELMATTDPRGDYHLATAADATAGNVFFGIIINDFEADDDHTVTQIYISGIFHEEKIILADGAKIADFELELRRQNIWLRKILDRFGHFDKVTY